MPSSTKNDIAAAFSSIYALINGLKSSIQNLFLSLIDNIFNSKTYKFKTSALLILLIVLLYFSIHAFNPFNVVKTKYFDLLMLSVVSLCVILFYFLVHRNQYKLYPQINDYSNKYSNDKNTFLKNKDAKSEKTFNTENIKNTFKNPIIQLLKALGGVISLIIIPVIFISLLFLAYNKNYYLFNVTRFILGIGIIFAAIAAGIMALRGADNSNDKNITLFLNNFDKSDTKNASLYVQLLRLIIKYLVLFIPCMLIIFSNFIHKEIKLTPSPVYLLFVLELFLICLFFLLPQLYKFFSSLSKNNLLKGEGPFYLNKHKVIGNYQQFSKNSLVNKPVTRNTTFSIINPGSKPQYNLQVSTNKKNEKKNPYKYTYSISFYLYLNPQSNNTSLAYNDDTEIFNYGNKPVILYNGKSRELIIKSKTANSVSSDLREIYKTKDIKYQKWLYFVINYEDNVIDVFIDGKLVGSKKNVPPYMSDDKVTIGTNDGIHGSIKDIYYYEKIIPKESIEFLYDVTKK
jgi:hypothetical protein